MAVDNWREVVVCLARALDGQLDPIQHHWILSHQRILYMYSVAPEPCRSDYRSDKGTLFGWIDSSLSRQKEWPEQSRVLSREGNEQLVDIAITVQQQKNPASNSSFWCLHINSFLLSFGACLPILWFDSLLQEQHQSHLAKLYILALLGVDSIWSPDQVAPATLPFILWCHSLWGRVGV